MIDSQALDKIVKQTAVIDAADAITGAPGRSVEDVLRHWLATPDSLSRVLPLILVRYRVATRTGAIPMNPLPSMAKPPEVSRRFRHFRGPPVERS